MVRAGRGAAYIDDFIDNCPVSLGFGRGNVGGGTDKSKIGNRLRVAEPPAPPARMACPWDIWSTVTSRSELVMPSPRMTLTRGCVFWATFSRA
jgi:hypothetical protein